jgi:hypothetical protein
MVIDMEEDVRSIYRPSIWAKRLEAYKAAEAALRESAPKVREADEAAAKALIEWADEYEENIKTLEERKPIGIKRESLMKAVRECREAIAREQDNYTEVSTEVRGEDGKLYTLNVDCNRYISGEWAISLRLDSPRHVHLLREAQEFCDLVGHECSDAFIYE